MLVQDEAQPLHLHLHEHPVGKLSVAAMVMFSAGYMISEPNLDGYTLEEALDYIFNEHIESSSVHIAGFVMSFLSNIPLLAAILYFWVREIKQHHEHHHHHHNHWQTFIEILTIGTPFSLMGVAAYLDTLSEILDVQALTPVQRFFVYAFSCFPGFLTGFGAYKLHSFHLHDAMEENGGGISGFFKSLYATFFQKVWIAHQGQDSLVSKALAILNEAWKKYGIIGVHGFLGIFAAEVFCKETGLNNKSPTATIVFKALLSAAVMIFEGNTEARSLDSYQAAPPFAYSLYAKLVVTFSGILHTIPAVTACSSLIGQNQSGPFEGKLYNGLTYLGAASLLAYPSVYGFFSTTIKGYQEAASAVANKITNFFCKTYEVEGDVEEQNNNEEGWFEQSYKKLSFWRQQEEPEPKPKKYSRIIFGLDPENPDRYVLI